jgi:hypothetical protein
MIHGQSFYKHGIPQACAGRTLQDETLSRWLAEACSHYIVGRLVEGPAWPESPVPDPPRAENAKRGPEFIGLRRDEYFPDSLIPEDIREWLQKTDPSPELYRHRMAERFGRYEDDATNDRTKRKLGSDDEPPPVARLLKIRRIGDAIQEFTNDKTTDESER